MEYKQDTDMRVSSKSGVGSSDAIRGLVVIISFREGICGRSGNLGEDGGEGERGMSESDEVGSVVVTAFLGWGRGGNLGEERDE